MNKLLNERYVAVEGLENALEMAKALIKNDYQVMVQLDDCDIYIVAFTENATEYGKKFTPLSFEEIDAIEDMRASEDNNSFLKEDNDSFWKEEYDKLLEEYDNLSCEHEDLLEDYNKLADEYDDNFDDEDEDDDEDFDDDEDDDEDWDEEDLGDEEENLQSKFVWS